MRLFAAILCRLLAIALPLGSVAAGPGSDAADRLGALGGLSPVATAPVPAKPARKPTNGPVIAWNAQSRRMTANVARQPLSRVLPKLARATGWRIYIEPGTETLVSTAFVGLSARDALSRLFTDVDYALFPSTNGPSRLVVYRTAANVATQAVAAVDPDDRVKEELVVRFRKGTPVTPEELAKRTDGKVVGKLDALNAARLRYADAASADSARTTIGAVDGVDVEDNYRIPAPETPVGTVGSTVAPLGIKPAPVGTDRLIVGLVDTGVQSLGSGYDAFMVGHESVVPGAAAPAANGPLEHGTSMFANLLRSADASMGPDGGTARFGVLSVDVYNGGESTTSFDVAMGIQKAVEGKANVINLSLSSEADAPFLHQIISLYHDSGVLFFAAAGNEPVTTPMYPAAYPEVLAVSAGNRQGEFAPYANRGPFVDLVLPGSGIVPYGGDSWLVTGTSTATAYASGAAAGLWKPEMGAPANLVPTMLKNFGLISAPSAKRP